MNFTDLHKIENIFNEFLNEISYYICSRCNLKKKHPIYGHLNKKDALNLPDDCKINYQHHRGEFNNYIKSKKKFNKQYLENYFNDLEHGLFHGIMTSFILFLINKDPNLIPIDQKKEYFEKDFASSLLHDFLKCNQFSQQNHDKELIHYFDNLNIETYSHSNPPAKFYNKHLILSDRLELRRYPDYYHWVDERFKKLYQKMSHETKDHLNCFYNCIRPTLEYLFKNQNNIFIRHGVEIIEDFDLNTHYYPNKEAYWTYCKNNNEEAYAIEIDSIPFCKNLNEFHSNLQYGHCSNHDENNSWNRLKGFICFDDFKKYNGNIIISNIRDHLFAKSEIPIHKWIFLYRNLIDNDIHIINNLLNKNNRVISQKSVFHFFKLVKLIKERLIVLNC